MLNQLIPLIFQLVLLWLKNKFERDAAERARRKALIKEGTDAIKARDASAITRVFDRTRLRR